MKILLAQINPTIGDFENNHALILEGIEEGRKRGCGLVIFPELAITGYPPEDFLLLPQFQQAAAHHLKRVVEASRGIAVVVGTPRVLDSGDLANSAAIIDDGRLIGFQDKTHLPTYDVFDEHRYFTPAAERKLWTIKGMQVAVTVCEDIWQHGAGKGRDPIMDYLPLKPDLLINISASPFHMEKFRERFDVCAKPAATLGCPVLLCNQVGGNDSLIFDGYSLHVDGKGELVAHGKGFEKDYLIADLTLDSKPITYREEPVRDLYRALVLGLRDYFGKQGLKKACIGISGGIDSAVTAAIASEALGKENLLGIMMPSRYSSDASLADGEGLIANLGIKSWTVPIEPPFKAFLELLEPRFEGLPFDETEENMQARIRGMILMAVSNKFGHIVLSTGNKSETAMGYSTLYGDMVGGLGVLSDVTKRQVYALARWMNGSGEAIPVRILEKPPSAELKPDQKDSDSLPDYDIIDNVLEAYVRDHCDPEEIASSFGYPLALVEDLIRRIHRNEYKRRQMAIGLRVSKKAFSPGRKFPIVQRWTV